MDHVGKRFTAKSNGPSKGCVPTASMRHLVEQPLAVLSPVLYQGVHLSMESQARPLELLQRDGAASCRKQEVQNCPRRALEKIEIAGCCLFCHFEDCLNFLMTLHGKYRVSLRPNCNHWEFARREYWKHTQCPISIFTNSYGGKRGAYHLSVPEDMIQMLFRNMLLKYSIQRLTILHILDHHCVKHFP